MNESGQAERSLDNVKVGSGRTCPGGLSSSVSPVPRRKWHHRISAVQLLTGVIVAAALTVAFVVGGTFYVLQTTGIHSPTLRHISESEAIIAEVTPSRHDLASAYGMLQELQHRLPAEEVSSILNRLEQSEQEFNTLTDLWASRLSGDAETRSRLEDSEKSAREIFRIFHEEIVPALGRGELETVKHIRTNRLTPLYHEHTRATLDLVARLKADRAELQRDALAAQSRAWWSQMLVGAMALCMIGCGAMLVIRKVRSPLREMAATLRNLESAPDGSLARLSEYPGEFGTLGATLRTLLTEQGEARASAERLAQIARRTQSAVLMTDRSGVIEWVNEGFTRLTGYTFEEAMGKPARTLLHGPKTDPGESRRIDDAMLNAIAANAELINYSKDGREYVVRAEIEPLRDGDSAVTGFMLLKTDVTESRRRERALIEAEEQFRTLVNNIPGATYRRLLDADWTMIFVSDAVEEVTGYPASDFVSRVRTFESIIHEEDRRGVAESVRAAVDSRAAFAIEYRILHRDGSIRWVREKGRSVCTSASDCFLDGTIFDITAGKEAQRRISESEALQRSVLDTMAEGIVVQDLSGAIISCNPAAELILGLTTDELTGRTSQHPGRLAIREDMTDFPASEHPAMVTLRTGESQRGIVMGIIKPDGDRVWIRVNTEAIFDDTGTLSAVVASFADITMERRASEELARQRSQSERLALVARRTQNSVVVTDAQGRIEWVNDAFTRMTGYLLEEVKGVKPGVFLQGARTDPIQAERMSRAIAAGRGIEVEMINYSKFGKEFIVQIEIEPLNDERGVLTGFMAVQLDVTEQRATEKARREQQELLEGVLSVIPYAVFWKDVGSRYLGCNNQFAALAGVGEPENIVGKSDYDLPWKTEQSEAYVAGDRHVMTSGVPNLHVMETQRDATGRQLCVDTSKVPIRDDAGNIIGVLGIFADVTLQRAREGELDRTRQYLRDAIETLNAGIVMYDREERLVFCNQRYMTLYGHSPESLRAGRTYAEILTDFAIAHPERRGGMSPEEYAQSVLLLHRAGPGDREQQFGDQWIMVSDRRTADGGVVSLRTDVTGIKQQQMELARAKEAADAASNAKSQFLANMSHEIRTPMTAILGYADVLRDDLIAGASADKLVQTVETVRGAGQHLLTIINDVLDLSRIEAGRMEVERVEVDLPGLLEEIGSMLRPRASGKGVDFAVSFRTPIPSRVMTDPTRLRQILLNLGGNACKFTEAGSVTISVGGAWEDGLFAITIDVDDTGVGLTPEQIERLFKPFSQADASMSRRFGGTGLGLAISKRLTMLMGGDVVILRTESGKGTTFRLTLKLEPALGAAMVENPGIVRRAAALPRAANSVALEGRILLAEDGPDNQRLISLHLRKAGAEVEVAENGRIALDKIDAAEAEGRPYALLISDMQMPVMDGYSLARALRARGSRLAVLALTAHAMSDDRRLCLDAGCDDYASKPIDKPALLAACAKWIGQPGGDGQLRSVA